MIKIMCKWCGKAIKVDNIPEQEEIKGALDCCADPAYFIEDLNIRYKPLLVWGSLLSVEPNML